MIDEKVNFTFFNTSPKCYKVRLSEKDTVHPYRCEQTAMVDLALMPPSAKKLKVLGQYCVSFNTKAIDFSLEAAALFKKLHDFSNLYITYENIAKYYSKSGDFEVSNKYYTMYAHIKDSVFNEDMQNTIHEMSIKYESEKKETENQLLTLENENKNQLIYFAFGGCVLLIGLLFFIFRGYRLKQKANISLKEKNKIINETNKCIICLDNTISYCCVPCGHVYCYDCIDKTNNCYICRGIIRNKIKLFF